MDKLSYSEFEWIWENFDAWLETGGDEEDFENRYAEEIGEYRRRQMLDSFARIQS